MRDDDLAFSQERRARKADRKWKLPLKWNQLFAAAGVSVGLLSLCLNRSDKDDSRADLEKETLVRDKLSFLHPQDVQQAVESPINIAQFDQDLLNYYLECATHGKASSDKHDALLKEYAADFEKMMQNNHNPSDITGLAPLLKDIENLALSNSQLAESTLALARQQRLQGGEGMGLFALLNGFLQIIDQEKQIRQERNEPSPY